MADLVSPPNVQRFGPKGRRKATILVAGMPGSGKRTLARQLAFDPTVKVDVNIVTREVLDEPDEPSTDDRIRSYDIIVLLVDATSSVSLEWLERTLRALPPAWYLGRLAVGLTKLDEKTQRPVTMQDVRSTLDTLSPSIPCFPFTATTRPDASRRIHRLLDVALRNEESLNDAATLLLAPSSRIAEAQASSSEPAS